MRFHPQLLAQAELRAAELDIGADQVLITAGYIGAEDYARTFAAYFGLPFETFDGIAREHCALPDETLVNASSAGILLIDQDVLVVALGGRTSRNLADCLLDSPDAEERLRVTSNARLHAFAFSHCVGEIGRRAADALHADSPDLSAQSPKPRVVQRWIVMVAAISVSTLFFFGWAVLFAQVFVSFVFLGWAGLRLCGLCRAFGRSSSSAQAEGALPVYSVIVALYREHARVPGLIDAVARLDYPALGSRCTYGCDSRLRRAILC